MGDRAVEAPLGGREPTVEPARDVLDVAVQRAEVAVELGRVGDEVAGAALAEDDALGGPQLGDAAGEDDDPQQREHGDGGGRDGDDAGGGRQVVHGGEE